MSTEPLYRLDIVLDQKKPLWSWLQEMAALYRSAIINSNGKYKIISDRDDLPVRQVFHSGNILREKTEVRVGTDPMQINQITGSFSNRDIGYERDILIIQDSQSILIDNEAIKPTDLDLTGISRKSEVNRRLSLEMRRRNEIKTEMTFFTNVQGINVEPGDVCIAGIVMSNFEMGYGGLALDGSTTSLLADKPVALNSGTIYDLWVWHTEADTPELRYLTGSAEVINLLPTSPFNFAAQAGDRWAVAPQSDGLVKLLVKKVVHQEDGITQITGDEFVNVGFLLDCPQNSDSALFDPYTIPTNPWSITAISTNCNFCVQLHYTAPSCVGGSLIATATNSAGVFGRIHPTTTNLPPLVSDIRITEFPGSNATPGFFNQYGLTAENTITFITGPNSGLSRRIIAYPIWRNFVTGSGEFYMRISPLPNIATSGDQYYISFTQTSNFQGMRVRYWTGTYNAIFTGSVNVTEVVNGNSYCFDLAAGGDSMYATLDLISSHGAYSVYGNRADHSHTFQLAAPGCFDPSERITQQVDSIVVGSLTNLLGIYLPASELTIDQAFEIRAFGFLNELCSSGEATRASFGVSYAGSTVINSHVIVLRDANSPATSIGSNIPFTLTGVVRGYTVPISHVRISYRYDGPILAGSSGIFSYTTTQFVSGMITSVNPSLVQSFAFTVHVNHTDTTGAVHSHTTCFAVALDHGEFEIIDPLGVS